MRQFVYFSTAADRQDAIVTADILAVSRSNNLRENITGLLVVGGHRYLQVIEGPAHQVETTVARIRRDPRHQSMTALVDRPIPKRNFAGWSMAFHVAPTLGEFATFEQLVDHMRCEILDRGLREQIDCFARSFVIPSVQPIALPWTMATRYVSALALDRSH